MDAGSLMLLWMAGFIVSGCAWCLLMQAAELPFTAINALSVVAWSALWPVSIFCICLYFAFGLFRDAAKVIEIVTGIGK